MVCGCYYNQTYLGHAILLLSAPIYQLTRHIMSQSCSPPILGEIDNLLTYVHFGENFMSTEIQLANNVKLEGHPNHLTWQKQ